MNTAKHTQDKLQAAQPGLTLSAPPLIYGYGYFTTRTNVQFNWIPITRAAIAKETGAASSAAIAKAEGGGV